MASYVIPAIFSAIDKITAPIRQMIRGVNSFAQAAESAGARASRALRHVGDWAGRAFTALNPLSSLNGMLGLAGFSIGVSSATLVLGKFIRESSKIEDATARFEPLVHGLKAAQELVKQINIEGAKTPYEFINIADIVANFLPALKGNATKAIEIFRMVGDTAGGNLERLNRIALGYNKVLLKQKVTLEGLSIIAEAGVPIYNEMAKVMYGNADATSRLFKEITAGKVPISAMEKAFVNMTSKGGLFYEGMIKGSATFTGVMSTLRDTINAAMASIGIVALPALKELAQRATVVAARIQVWADQNKDLIKTKVTEWIEKTIKVAKWLYKHFDDIVRITKIYLGVLIGLKIIALVTKLVWGFQFAMGVLAFTTGAVTGNLILNQAAAMGVMFASKAAAAGIWLLEGAQWALNIAMSANPIGLIIIGIAALGILVYKMIKHWDEWGASVTVMLGPLGMVVSLAKTFYDHWSKITRAFQSGGMISGLKAIGKVILESILYPLEQLLSTIGKLPMGGWAKAASNQLADIRNALGTGPNQISGNSVPVQGGQSPFELINPKLQQRQMIEQTFNNTTSKQQTEIIVKAAPGTTAEVSKNTGGAMPKVTNSIGELIR